MKPAGLLRAAAGRALFAALACAPLTAFGQSGADSSTQALAKQAQNPIANLISIPIQSNTDFGVGPDHSPQEILFIQPVVPFKLSGDWNLITRWILPVIDQPRLAPAPVGQGNTFGIGDINPSAFITHISGNLVWGAGPTFVFPTASDHVLGAGQWSMGPTAVILYTPGKWVLGVLANNVWSYANTGGGRPDVDQALVQPFVNYNLSRGWYLSTSPYITCNWRADPHDRWTLPLGGGVGRLVRFGKVPVNTYLQAYGNVVTPTGGADWSLRAQVQVLLPK